MSHAAIIVAAGKGVRAGGSLPKQYQLLAGEAVLRRTIRAFDKHPLIDRIQVVIAEGQDELFADAAKGFAKVLPPVTGDAERQGSVLKGLEALAGDPPTTVLIHDAARPFVTAQTITHVIESLDEAEGAIAALPVSDTLKRDSGNAAIAETVPRQGLWRAQTPQGFRFPIILSVHRDFSDRQDMTDDASLLEAAGIPVRLIEDLGTNMKITRPEDFALAERMIDSQLETRVGSGFDVHAFEPGDHVSLCGVNIPHTAKLKGHSDADVGMHTLTDAIYGAIAEGDIGSHFPPSDPQWKGAASEVFLRHAASRVRERGGKILHCDVTIICEAPKVGPHRETMRQVLAELMAIDIGRVAVKATTTEKLGFTGRKEGIAAQATVTVGLPAAS